jgi:hypothetical protein
MVEINEKHKRLFKIKYLDKILSEEAIKKEAGLSEQELIVVGKELDRHLIGVLNGVVSPERIESVCPDCLEAKTLVDIERDETVCTRCGYVYPDVTTPDDSLPFDQAFKPSSDLSSDGGLGSSLQKTFTSKAQYELQKQSGGTNQSFKVFQKTHVDLAEKLLRGEPAYDANNVYLLDQSGNEKVYNTTYKDIATYVLNKKLLTPTEISKMFHMNDLPLRFYRLRILSSAENPELDKLLKEAFGISIKYGLDNDKVFNNNLGRNIRRAFHLVHDMKIKVPKQTIATSAFYYTLYQGNRLNGQILTATLNIKYELPISKLLFKLLMKFHNILGELHKEAEVESINTDQIPFFELHKELATSS